MICLLESTDAHYTLLLRAAILCPIFGDHRHCNECNEHVESEKGATSMGLRPFVMMSHRCEGDRSRLWFVSCIFNHMVSMVGFSTRVM